MHCVLRQGLSRLSQIFCPFGFSASLCGAPVFLHWLCFGLLAYRECLRLLDVFLDLGEPADALAINAVISMQLEVHEWVWLGCGWVPFPCVLAWLGYGWVPFPCYYLIEMQNTIILLQSQIHNATTATVKTHCTSPFPFCSVFKPAHVIHPVR